MQIAPAQTIRRKLTAHTADDRWCLDIAQLLIEIFITITPSKMSLKPRLHSSSETLLIITIIIVIKLRTWLFSKKTGQGRPDLFAVNMDFNETQFSYKCTSQQTLTGYRMFHVS